MRHPEWAAVAGDLVELPAITLRLAAFDDAVVVTATRIEEPLQQVPLSISAVTGADIERRAIGNLTELSTLFAYHLAFGITGLLPDDFPALARARAIDPGVSAADLTAQFRSFSAYTREESREERFNWETRLVSAGGGAALELLYGYTYIGDVLAPRRAGVRIRYAFG